MADPSLAEVAAKLYMLPPSEFIAERNARAKQVADRGLAEQIRSLRKPSITAAVVNVFAQERADRLGQVLQLAAELRDAQEGLDAQTLSKLGRERRTLTRQLAQEAVSLSTARGWLVAGATVQGVEQTITAAFFDPDAAAAVASGRLLRVLEPSIDFPLDFDNILGGGAPERRAVSVTEPADEVRVRREQREAEKVVHAAERALERAKREQSKANRVREAAAADVRRLAAKVEELEAEFERARGDAENARTAAEDTAVDAAKADDLVRDAESTVNAARLALERNRPS